MYYDASYFLAPDGQAGEDVYAVLREAISKTGKTALTRVVIAQRERTVALRPMGAGLMAHTLYEERDLNNPQELFEDARQAENRSRYGQSGDPADRAAGRASMTPPISKTATRLGCGR